MITIIWHSNRENSWEKDWIEYLFAKTPHHTITDYSQELIWEVTQAFDSGEHMHALVPLIKLENELKTRQDF